MMHDFITDGVNTEAMHGLSFAVFPPYQEQPLILLFHNVVFYITEAESMIHFPKAYGFWWRQELWYALDKHHAYARMGLPAYESLFAGHEIWSKSERHEIG